MPASTNTPGIWIARFKTSNAAGRLGFVDRDKAEQWVLDEVALETDLEDCSWSTGEFTWRLATPEDDISAVLQHIEVEDASAIIQTNPSLGRTGDGVSG